ncbi:MAG: zinc-binding dehydrogenase [Actinomycetota bacterium]
MRAWVLDEDADGYRLGDLPAPTIGPWDVQVALRTSALNHLDLWAAKGMPKPLSYPHVPGADGAGVVVDVGQAVEDLSPGAEVVIDPSTSCGRCEACLAGDIPYCPLFTVIGEHRWGTHADLVVVPGTNAVRKPEDPSWEQAGSFGLVVSSAVRMARRGRIAPGSKVLVVGVGGGSASAAFLVATALGAQTYATSRDETTRAWAIEHGASAVFDSATPYDEELRAATGGRGVDVVIDNVGAATFERSLHSLTKGGRLVTNGSTSGRSVDLTLPTLFWRQLEVIGASMNDRMDFAEALRLVATGQVEVPAASIPFDGYPAALERLDRGRQIGKLILVRESL